MKDNNNSVLVATDYNKVDGQQAYKSNIKMLSLENTASDIMANVWQTRDDQSMELLASLPVHQIFDMAIFICSGLTYFREAYRYPKLYNPENPIIDRIGLQGSAMTVSVCRDNQNIDEEIQKFSQIISNQGELFGERLRILSRILEEMR